MGNKNLSSLKKMLSATCISEIVFVQQELCAGSDQLPRLSLLLAGPQNLLTGEHMAQKTGEQDWIDDLTEVL